MMDVNTSCEQDLRDDPDMNYSLDFVSYVA